MNRKEWQALEKARKLLGLGDKATLNEIKRAYHRLSKENHPDLVGQDMNRQEKEEKMYRITTAYELITRYCSEYRFPMTADKNNIYDAEDWWLDRFGSDPLWGKTKK